MTAFVNHSPELDTALDRAADVLALPDRTPAMDYAQAAATALMDLHEVLRGPVPVEAPASNRLTSPHPSHH